MKNKNIIITEKTILRIRADRPLRPVDEVKGLINLMGRHDDGRAFDLAELSKSFSFSPSSAARQKVTVSLEIGFFQWLAMPLKWVRRALLRRFA